MTASDAHRLQRIREVFEGASAEPPETRKAFLLRHCNGDNEMREELERLLDADVAPHSLLDRPFPVLAGPAELETSPLEPGARVGPYRILRGIAVGGMGSVYLAAPDGEPEARPVALKILKWISADAAARFAQERAILTRFDHPNIARLLDSGVAEDGQPYIVMEYVEGLPLHQHCDRHGLSVDERLGLMRQVSGAVEHLHGHGVVHRDLKPGNILITAGGVVKLLDFGIAKLLAGEAAGNSRGTITGIMTPDYASPEQVRGESASERTDVYGLGILLYELLTGVRPFASNDISETLRRIAEEEPRRPSRICVQLDGEIDSIVLKAIRKEPERRYWSVHEFNEDLRRRMERAPVLAQGDSIVYRCRKWVTRKRIGLVWAAALVAVVAAVSFFALGERTSSSRRLDDLERVAQSAMRAYSSGAGSPQVAETAHDALLALGRAGRSRPGMDEMLDRIAAEAHIHASVQDPDWDVPAGWQGRASRAGEYLVSGGRVLSVRSRVERPEGIALVFQRFDAEMWRGKRVRFSGSMESKGLVGSAAIGIRAFPVDGGPGVYDDASITGTTRWGKKQVVLDVADMAGVIEIRVQMNGTGEVSVERLSFERVPASVPLTRPRRPANLDFTGKQ